MPDLMPTDGMREEAQRYRDWKAEGRRGGTAVAARRATQILSGDALSEDVVITMAAWFARHEVDKQGQGFSPGEDGYPSPGRVAWAAWGGDAGQSWSTAKARAIKAEDGRSIDTEQTVAMTDEQRPYPNEHAARLRDPAQYERFRRVNDEGGPGVDFIYGVKSSDGEEVVELQAVRFDAERFTPAEARQWLTDHDHTAIEFEEATGQKAKRELTAEMSAGQAAIYEALEEIADELGAFNQGTGAHGAHYMPESPFASQGMKCANCAFYAGPAACEIVEGEIAPEGVCKFWIIPESKLTAQDQSPSDGEIEGRTLRGLDLRERFRDGVIQKRELTANLSALPADADRMEFSFSSEQPVDRWFGREVLSHEQGAADLSRLNSGAPFLWNHDRDVVLGVVEKASIDSDRRGKTGIRWARNAAAVEKRQDVEDGILSKVSFAYEINEAVDRGNGEVLVTKWTPLEVSLVSIPADDSVGLGRSLEVSTPMEPIMIKEQSAQPETMEQTMNHPDPEVIRSEAATAERDRITGINNLCEKHGMTDLASDLISGGRSIDEARAAVLDKLGKRSRELQSGGLHVESDALVGLDQRDLSRYSITKLMRYLADPTNAAARDAAGFELEVSRATEQHEGRSANGALVPFDWMVAKRGQTVGNFSQGGALVGTELLAGSFIDLLRNQSALMQSGITMITGLTGNVDIPRKTAASQHYWVGEDVDLTASEATFGLISSTPKTIGVRVPVSRRALIQTTPDIDTLIRSDMAETLGLGVDAAGLYGSGSNGQPLGLSNVTGIGSVTLGGGASLTYPASLGGGTHDTGDWADYVNLRGSAYAANVNVANSRYVMNGITMSGCEQTLRASAAGSDYIINDAGNIGRYPVIMSNQVQTNDVFYGVFSDLILATWSGLDIVVDPYTQSAKGQVIYTVMQDIDWVCRRAASFSKGS